MKTSYAGNFARIYLWKGLSFSLNFLSMFIVVPRITSEPTIYGVYMVCISTAMFLSYADIGFIGAGYKYSAECYARRDLKAEIEIQGFVGFVLTFFVSLFVLFYLLAAFRPEILIKDLNNPLETQIASNLLLIQGVFSYSIVLQRLNNAVFGIRLEDYIFQKIQIVAFSIRILSVFYFFRSDSYDIVGYFLFSKLVELVAVLIGLFLAKRRYGYAFGALAKSFRFSRKIFSQTKGLAFASFYITIMWVLYYELDSIAIAKLLGAQAVAYFAIGLTISKFFRNISGIIYAPFRARFNHFIGLNDQDGLRRLYLTAIKRTMPIVVFPLVSIIVLMKPLIVCWVGADYLPSIKIALFLIFSNFFMFINAPTKMLVTALENIRVLYLSSTLMTIVYWSGIFFTVDRWQVESFAIFKFTALMIACLVYLAIAMRYLKLGIISFVKTVIFPATGPILCLIVSLMMTAPFLPVEKGKLNLLLVVGTGGLYSTAAFGLYYLISLDFRQFINQNIMKIRKRGVRSGVQPETG